MEHSDSPFLTIKQYSERYPFLKERTLRNWIFNARDNGADAWIRRIGRRVYVNVEALHRWIDERGQEQPAPRQGACR